LCASTITYTTGSLFDPSAQVLVNPVNTAGVMGKGLAYEFKQRFREMYAEYGIASIAFPALGCGAGGLDYESQVRPLMHHYLHDLPLDVFLYHLV